MDTRELLLIIHITGALMLAGGSLSATALGIYAGNTASTHTIRVASDLQHKIEYFLTVPGALLAIIFGSLLVADADYISFSDGWVSAAFLLWFVAMGLGTGVLGRHAKRVRAQADQLIAQGASESAELKAAFGPPMVKVLGLTLNILLVVFVYLMVVKPGA